MDVLGGPWVRTGKGRVALPKGREGDMLHSQLVKLGQLQGRKEVRAKQSTWIISEEPTATKHPGYRCVNRTCTSTQNHQKQTVSSAEQESFSLSQHAATLG